VPFCRGVPLTLKAQKPKGYSGQPETLGEHLKKRRRELRLFQREAAAMMGIAVETLINWEKDRTRPVAAQFRPVVAFLGYDPTPDPRTLAERLEAKRRALGVTFDQVAQYLGWDRATLNRYVHGVWKLRPERTAALEQFLSAPPNDLIAVRNIPKRSR